jgi:transcription antitermination factor NusG
MGDDLEVGNEASAVKRCWHALYTRPRFERKVRAFLEQKQLVVFLPEREVIHQWSNNRIRKIKEPLFPSYVFIYVSAKERTLSVCTPGVAYIVGVKGKPCCIPDDEIESIQRILNYGYDPEPYEYFEFGDQVEITCGPLKGIRGVFIQERSRAKLIVSVHLIHQSLAIAIDRGQIRKVNSAPPPKVRTSYF